MMVENVNFAPSAAGDIVLNTPRQKSRKWLVAGTIILAVLIGVVVIILIITSKNNRRSLSDSFNQYANFILYGTESDIEISGDFEINKSYRITQELFYSNDDSQSSEYINALKSKLDNFGKFYNDNKSSMDTSRSDLIERNINLSKFAQNYYYYGQMDLDEIAKKYSGDGPDATRSYISSNFAIFTDIDFYESKAYGDAMNAYYQNFLAILEQHVDRECLKQGFSKMTELCPKAKIELSKEEQKTLSEAESMKDGMAKTAEQLTRGLAENCFDLAKNIGDFK